MLGFLLATFPAAISVNSLGWMAGSWACPQDGGTFEEAWLPPAGKTMQGMGRLIVGNKTRFMEFMSIEADEKGLVMWMLLGAPSKGSNKGVPFRLRSFDGKTASFENPENDFPKRIVYSKRDGKSLGCYIEGPGKDGKNIRDDYSFKRLKI